MLQSVRYQAAHQRVPSLDFSGGYIVEEQRVIIKCIEQNTKTVLSFSMEFIAGTALFQLCSDAAQNAAGLHL